MRILLRSSVWLSLAAAAWGQPYQVKIESAVPVKVRDGALLVADVYRPQADAKFPMLLQRTPYNRAGGASGAVEIASHGYVVVLQDTRGRYDSGRRVLPVPL